MLWLAMAAGARAGVWVREQGEVYVQASAQHAEATRAFDAQGVLRDQSDETFLGVYSALFEAGRTSVSDLGLYAELGLGHGFEVVGALPLRFVTNRWTFGVGASPDIRHWNLGLGDAMLGARFGTIAGSSAVSVLASVRAPLYDNAPDALNVEAGNSDFYDDRVPLGNGTIDVDLSAGVGTSWGWGWSLAEAGVRFRDRQMSAALPGRVQLGFKPHRRVALWCSADGVVSLGTGTAPDRYVNRFGKGPSIVDNQTAVSAVAGASLDFSDSFGIYAAGSRVVVARRYPLLTSVTGGVVVQFGILRPADFPMPLGESE